MPLIVEDGTPWSIARVRRPWWGKDQLARIDLRVPTRLGRTVPLLLPFSLFTRWSERPEARMLLERSRSRQ